jgi:uncharacterized protein (TIGR02996 family)
VTHDDAFLHAILSNSDDDTPRFIDAAYLDEPGEFIRVQVTPAGDPRCPEPEARERGLLE